MPVADLKADILGSVDVLPSLQGKVRTAGRLNVCRALVGCADELVGNPGFEATLDRAGLRRARGSRSRGSPPVMRGLVGLAVQHGFIEGHLYRDGSAELGHDHVGRHLPREHVGRGSRGHGRATPAPRGARFDRGRTGHGLGDARGDERVAAGVGRLRHATARLDTLDVRAFSTSLPGQCFALDDASLTLGP